MKMSEKLEKIDYVLAYDLVNNLLVMSIKLFKIVEKTNENVFTLDNSGVLPMINVSKKDSLLALIERKLYFM